MMDPIKVFGERLEATLGDGTKIDLVPEAGKGVDVVWVGANLWYFRTFVIEIHNEKEVWILESTRPLLDVAMVTYSRPTQAEIDAATNA